MNKILKTLTILSITIISVIANAQSTTFSYPNVGGGTASITLNNPSYVGVDLVNNIIYPSGITGNFYFADGGFLPWVFNINKNNLESHFAGKSNIMITGTWSSPRPNVTPPIYLTVSWSQGTESVNLAPSSYLTTSWGTYTNNSTSYQSFTNPFTPSIQILLISQTSGPNGVYATYSTQSPGWCYNNFTGYYPGSGSVSLKDACSGTPTVNYGTIGQ